MLVLDESVHYAFLCFDFIDFNEVTWLTVPDYFIRYVSG